MRVLLGAGANVNLSAVLGETALILAASASSQTVDEVLY
jgi:ankyrin repeat protein